MEQKWKTDEQLYLTRIENGKSIDEYKNTKALPHINEEYQFRITNKNLVQKLINPRRDKTIINSLANTSFSQFYKNKKENNVKYRRKIIPSKCLKKQKASERDESNKIQDDKILRIKRNVQVLEERQVNLPRKEEQPYFQKVYFNGVRYSRKRQSRENYVGKIIKNTLGNCLENCSFTRSYDYPLNNSSNNPKQLRNINNLTDILREKQNLETMRKQRLKTESSKQESSFQQSFE